MKMTIRGWMDEQERLALRRWAFGRDVLEIGAFEGLSTVQLASTAKHVTSVDTFDGRGTAEPQDTRETFHKNLQACGLYDRVSIRPGESNQVLARLAEQDYKYDLAFIDGSHDYESVNADAHNCLRLLGDDGLLAFHDYNDAHPGVVRVVDELCANGCQSVNQTNSLVLLRGKRQHVAPKKINVAVLIPHRDGWVNMGSAFGVSAWLSQKYNRQVYNHGTSVLPHTFNELLCKVMNDQAEQFTHLAMLHNDVVPEQYWLDKLIPELEDRNLDMLSVVIPIKDELGLTSTGIGELDNPWAVRRLTLHEVFQLPETFTAADVPFRGQDEPLLLNTGCWVMRWDEPWTKGLCFRQQDRIALHEPTKTWVAQSQSEDWDWSRQLVSRGCRLGATRKVQVVHDNKMFHNRHPWGEWTEDKAYLKHLDEKAVS